MLIKDLIKLSFEYNDNINNITKKFFDKYFTPEYSFTIDIIKQQHNINILDKNTKKIVATCKINKLFDVLDYYNVLYWDWANVNTEYYNLDVKKIWEYGFNLINLKTSNENENENNNENINKFLRIIFLNSGLIINNKLTLNLVISLVSYILKKDIICFKFNSEKVNFKLVYENLDIVKKNTEYNYSYYYSVVDFKELKNNKMVKFN